MVEAKTKVMVGFLAVLLISTGVYVSLDDEGVKMRVDKDKSTFYVRNDNNRWVVSGREFNKLFDGSKLIYRHAKNISVVTEIDDESKVVKVTRSTNWYNGALIKDTYLFDGDLGSVDEFPIVHKVEVFNGNTCGSNGCIFQYEVRDLKYDGVSMVANNPHHFGLNMKVEWDSQAYLAKVYQQKVSDKLIAKYRITGDYHVFFMRLVDPVLYEKVDVELAEGGFLLSYDGGSEYLCSGGDDWSCSFDQLERVGVCDSRFDGNGDGICQIGETCQFFNITNFPLAVPVVLYGGLQDKSENKEDFLVECVQVK